MNADVTEAEPDVGLLSAKQFQRAHSAYECARALMPWLRVAGYVRLGEEDVRVQTSREPSIGIPPTKLAYLEIERIVSELNRWPELIDATRDLYGQFLLASLVREVQAALSRWPMEDRPRRIRSVRCCSCGQFTLWHRPPSFPGDTTRVKCRCGFAMTDDEFAEMVSLVEKEERERKLGDR